MSAPKHWSCPKLTILATCLDSRRTMWFENDLFCLFSIAVNSASTNMTLWLLYSLPDRLDYPFTQSSSPYRHSEWLTGYYWRKIRRLLTQRVVAEVRAAWVQRLWCQKRANRKQYPRKKDSLYRLVCSRTLFGSFIRSDEQKQIYISYFGFS